MSWERLLDRRLGILVSAAALTAALLPGLFLLQSDNSPRVFFVRDSAAVEDYRAFLEVFGNDSSVRVVVRGPIDAAATAWISRLRAEFAELPGVRSATGPTGFAELDAEVGWRRDHSEEGSIASLVLLLENLEPRPRDALLSDLQERIAQPPKGLPEGLEAELVGLPLLNRALDQSAQEIGRRYFPLLIGLAVLLVFLVVRDLRTLLIVLAYVGLCELTTLATMAYLGVRLNLILAILPPLLFAISLATALHVLLAYRDGLATQPDARAASLAACREKGWAVFWTGATTVVGFLSLAASPVAPVRALGLWAGFGLAVMTLFALTVFPCLLATIEARAPCERRFEKTARRFGRIVAAWACRRRGLVLAAAASAVLLAAISIPGLRIETNALTYLSAEHPARRALERLDADGLGAASVEVLLHHDAAFDAAELQALHRLGRKLAEHPSVRGAVSRGSFPAVWGTFVDPRLAEALQEAQSAFVAEDGRLVRMVLMVPALGGPEMDALLAVVREEARSAFPDAGVTLTGQLPTLLEAQRFLLKTLGLSLGLTLLVVVVVFRLVLGGSRMTLLALLPNLWPVLGMFGVMALLEIPLDVATVMVASIALGLAVDDTIHSLGCFRVLHRTASAPEAAVQTLETTAPAYVLTGVVLALGFGVCAASSFAPTARFGFLAAVAVVLAVVGDLLLVPALLSLAPRRAREARTRR